MKVTTSPVEPGGSVTCSVAVIAGGTGGRVAMDALGGRGIGDPVKKTFCHYTASTAERTVNRGTPSATLLEAFSTGP